MGSGGQTEEILSTVDFGFPKSSIHVAPKHGFFVLARKNAMDSFQMIFTKREIILYNTYPICRNWFQFLFYFLINRFDLVPSFYL